MGGEESLCRASGLRRAATSTARAVWANILASDYIAQDFAPPGERQMMLDGVATSRKVDVRLYTYNGDLLLAAARLYQGQTTNFRTEGGGFPPVYLI